MLYQTTGNPGWNWHIPIHSTLHPLSRLLFRISGKDFVPVSVTGLINGSKKTTWENPEQKGLHDDSGEKVSLSVISKRLAPYLFQHRTLTTLVFSIYWYSFLPNLSEVEIVAGGDLKTSRQVISLSLKSHQHHFVSTLLSTTLGKWACVKWKPFLKCSSGALDWLCNKLLT